jgi:hypothetical protein
MNPRDLPPYRRRTPSGHDVPIPESVFQAIAQVQQENAGTRAEVAGLRSDFAELKEAVTKLASHGKAETLKIIGGVIVAALGVIGGQRALAPSPPPTPAPQIRQVRTDLDVRLDECRDLPQDSPDRRHCWRRVKGGAGAE